MATLTERLEALKSDDWQSRHAAMEQQLAETQEILDTPISARHNINMSAVDDLLDNTCRLQSSSSSRLFLPWSTFAIATISCGFGILLGLGIAGFGF